MPQIITVTQPNPEVVQVVMEASNMEELTSMGAKNAALQAASAEGFGQLSIRRTSGPHAILSSGKPIETAEDIQQFQQETHLNNGQCKFRNVFDLQRSL